MPYTIDAAVNEATVTFTGLSFTQVLALLAGKQAALDALNWRVDHVYGVDQVVAVLKKTLPPGDAVALAAALT